MNVKIGRCEKESPATQRVLLWCLQGTEGFSGMGKREDMETLAGRHRSFLSRMLSLLLLLPNTTEFVDLLQLINQSLGQRVSDMGSGNLKEVLALTSPFGWTP